MENAKAAIVPMLRLLREFYELTAAGKATELKRRVDRQRASRDSRTHSWGSSALDQFSDRALGLLQGVVLRKLVLIATDRQMAHRLRLEPEERFAEIPRRPLVLDDVLGHDLGMCLIAGQHDNLGLDHHRAEARAEVNAIDKIVRALDAAREKSGISKAGLAAAIDAHPEVVRRLFTQKSPNPTLSTLIRLAAALGYHVELVRDTVCGRSRRRVRTAA